MTPWKRSDSSCALPFVVRLNRMPPVADAVVITASTRAHLRARQLHAGAALALGRRLALERHQPHEDEAERDADDPRHRERRAPAEPLHEQTGQAGGDRDAEVAGESVDADRRARA
jgi:hypothetical protein